MGRVPSLWFSCSIAIGPWTKVKILLPQFPHLLNEGFGGNYCQMSSLKMESSHSISLGSHLGPSLSRDFPVGGFCLLRALPSDHSNPTEGQGGH